MPMLDKSLTVPIQTDFPMLDRIPGAPVFQKPEWVDVTFSANYKTSVFFVGDRIFVNRPAGYPRQADMEATLNFTRRLTTRHIAKPHPYVQIEDYRNLNGISLEARRHFVAGMSRRESIQALIFCNVEPVFKVIYQLIKRIPFVQRKVHLADDYPQALQLAFDLLGHSPFKSAGAAADLYFKEESSVRSKNNSPSAENELRRLADELLLFLTSVTWWDQNDNGCAPPFVDENHPFYPVFSAILHIKGELGELSRAHQEAIDTLRAKEKELESKTRKLEESGIALSVLLQKKDETRKALENNVTANFQHLIMPGILKLKRMANDPVTAAQVDALSADLDAVFSPFVKKLSSKYARLTPMEIKVANLVKHGKNTNQVCASLDLSYKTVETHRMNIRKKLGLTHTKTNLRTYLQSL